MALNGEQIILMLYKLKLTAPSENQNVETGILNDDSNLHVFA